MAICVLHEKQNKLATINYLTQLCCKDQISQDDIYTALGVEMEERGYSIDQQMDKDFYDFAYDSILIPNDTAPDDFNVYCATVLDRDYKTPEAHFYYYHGGGSKDKINERMIFNVQLQSNAIEVMKALLGAYRYISGVKILAYKSKPSQTRHKYDKIVVYYHNKWREKVGEALVTAGLNPGIFLDDISGFYDIYHLQATTSAPSYPAGIGREVDGDTSFTTQNAWELLALLTGKLVSEFDKEDNSRTYPMIEKYRTITDRAVFSKKLFEDAEMICQ